MKRIILSIVFSLPVFAMAEEVPLPPDVQVVEEGEVLAPEVTIIQKEKETIYEYRVNGQLKMVKVQPAVGPAYYFVDQDGDGELETRTDDPAQAPPVPLWELFRF